MLSSKPQKYGPARWAGDNTRFTEFFRVKMLYIVWNYVVMCQLICPFKRNLRSWKAEDIRISLSGAGVPHENPIFYSYVIKHCNLWSLIQTELTRNGREGFVSSWSFWVYLVHSVEFRWFPNIESVARAQSISNEHPQSYISFLPSSSLL